MVIGDITSQAVLAAIDAYEQVHRGQFLRQLGFTSLMRPGFVIVRDDKAYDPLALIVHAHRNLGLGTLDVTWPKPRRREARALLERLDFYVVDGNVEKCEQRGCWGRADWLTNGRSPHGVAWEPILECDRCSWTWREPRQFGESRTDRRGYSKRHLQKAVVASRQSAQPQIVAAEATNVSAFAKRATDETTGERCESDLTARYQAWLGRALRRWQIPDGRGRWLFTDLYDEELHELYEAKGNVNRESIRMAIGELQDYRRPIEKKRPGLRLSILLPKKPEPDLVELILAQGYTLVHEDERGTFQRQCLKDP